MMNDRSLKQIKNRIKKTEEETQGLKKTLRITSKERLKRLISVIRMENERYKLYKKAIKGQIKSNLDTIDELEENVDKLATFDFDNVTMFITKAISIIEQEQYQCISFDLKGTVSNFNPALTALTNTPMQTTETKYEYVTLITTSKNMDLISRMYDAGDITSSYKIKYTLDDKDSKYILLKNCDTYTIFNSETWRVPEELTSNYPYLEEIISGLIDLKLENNNLSEEQVATLMLKKISQTNLVKKETSRK